MTDKQKPGKSPGLKSACMLFLGGLTYFLGLPNAFLPEGPVGPLISVCLFLALVRGEDLKKKLLLCLAYSLGYNLPGFYWIPETLEQFGNIVQPWSSLLWILLSPVLISHYIAYIVLVHILEKITALEELFCRPALRNLFLAFLLCACEVLAFRQFPADIGHMWFPLAPYVGLTPIFGTSLFSFISYWLVLSLLDLFKTRILRPKAFIFCAILLLLNILFPLKYDTKAEQYLNLRVVQANIGSLLKVDAETGDTISQQKVINQHQTLSTQVSKIDLDLIIWPETAFPEILVAKTMIGKNELTPIQLDQTIKKTQADLFIGTYDEEPNADRSTYENQYNAAMLFNKDSILVNYYHKFLLIPFGETLPFGPFNKFLSRIITNISYFSKGNRYPLFKTTKGPTFIAAICYEILFPRFMNTYLNQLKERPDFIVNITNDSWYGKTIQPQQHLYLARWRAIELNLPIVRSTNTGITSILFPDGSESPRLPWYSEQILDWRLSLPKTESTPYQKWGYLNLLGLWLLLFILEAIWIWEIPLSKGRERE